MEQEAKRDDTGCRMDLLVPEFLEAMGHIMDVGAKKYGELNWKKGLPGTKSGLNHALKHLMEYMRKHPCDYGDLQMHLAQVAVNCMFEYWFCIRSKAVPVLKRQDFVTGGAGCPPIDFPTLYRCTECGYETNDKEDRSQTCGHNQSFHTLQAKGTIPVPTVKDIVDNHMSILYKFQGLKVKDVYKNGQVHKQELWWNDKLLSSIDIPVPDYKTKDWIDTKFKVPEVPF